MSFTDEENTARALPGPASSQDPAQSLDEITRVLRRMLALAELSASDLDLDRQLMQKTLERLSSEVDRLADSM